MKKYENMTFDAERALYGSNDVQVINCRFEGPADGESALKEGQNITVFDSFFNLRYPFWHNTNLKISDSEMTVNCRAPIWYTNTAEVKNTRIDGVKALRECSDIKMEGCNIVSPEFGWNNDKVTMVDCDVTGEYFMMRSTNMEFKRVVLNGKYSFQYIENCNFENCTFDTKDAFWHAKNVHVKNSTVNGEYLGWYCENVTFENCILKGTQPLCYCKGLKLINCRMVDADLAFEKSDVDAQIKGTVESIKNPYSGTIAADCINDIIMNDPEAHARIVRY